MSAASDEALAWAQAWISVAAGTGPMKPVVFNETCHARVPVFENDVQARRTERDADGTERTVWRDQEIAIRVEAEPVAYLKRAVWALHACRDGVVNARAEVAKGRSVGPYGVDWYTRIGLEKIAAINALRAALERQSE